MTVYKIGLYFTPLLRHNSETSILIKRDKSKIQAMNMGKFENIERKVKRERMEILSD
jgi:hypothetical protein